MYAIYLRKSRKDVELENLGEGETLARHRQALTDLARKKELVVSKIYEEVVSGESIADRPQMQMLLDDVMMGKYKGVLVMEIERLARGNTKDQGEVAEAFAMSKTLIVTPTKTYDPTNEFDEEYFEFGLFMSRREYKTIRRRMQRGIIASVKEGNYLGSVAPYGYDIVRINKKERTLKLNENEAQYVRMMFDWFVNEGLTAGMIARKLTLMGVPTRKGRKEWFRGTITDMLQNIIYAGKVHWNKRKTIKELEDGSIKKKRNRKNYDDDVIIVDGKHPAIITMETYEKAQSLFKGSIPVKACTTLVNPLATILVCAKCGSSIAYRGYNERPTVKPRYAHSPKTTCHVKSMPAEEVIEALQYGLREAVEDFEFKLKNENIINEREKLKNRINALEKELKNNEDKRRQLFDYFERNLYTPEEFLERKELINKTIENIKNTLEEEKMKKIDEVDYEEKIFKYSKVIESLNDKNINARFKNKLLKEIINKIEYDCEDFGRIHGGKITLDIHFK